MGGLFACLRGASVYWVDQSDNVYILDAKTKRGVVGVGIKSNVKYIEDNTRRGKLTYSSSPCGHTIPA